MNDKWNFEMDEKTLNIYRNLSNQILKYLCDFLYDEFIGQIKNMYTNIAETSGMDHKYAELYGDFSSGMLMESFAAISGAGIKSANALKNGEAIYDGDVVAGSGIGNLGGKGKTTHEGVSNRNKFNFSNEKKFDKHFDKHVTKQGEFGNITKDEYLKLANEFIDSSGKNVLSRTASNGDILKFNIETDEFSIVTKTS